MLLTCDDETISKVATANDVARALAIKPRGENWFVKLANDGGDYLELSLGEDGELAAEYKEKGRVCHATSSVDETLMKTLLTSYLATDGRWKTLCAWEVQRPESAASSLIASVFGPKSSRKKPDAPMPILIAATGIGILLMVLPWIPERFLPMSLLPGFMRETAALPVMLIFLAMPTLIVVGLVAKLLEARKAAKWPQARGRIVKSTIEAKQRQHMDEASTVENVPAIAYEFTVGGFAYRGTRIGIGEDAGGPNLDATLARYPVGANVIVHYNPKTPKDCVLEYGGPQGLGKGCGTTLLSIATFGPLIYVAYENFWRLEAALPAQAHAKLMVITALIGLVSLSTFFSARRRAAAAAAWPKTSGKVVISSVESFTKSSGGRSSTYHEPVVEYAYTVQGHEFHSREIDLDGRTAGGRTEAAQMAARYPVGKKVQVFYDPTTPSQAALRIDTESDWIALSVAVIMLAVAVYASGVFH